MSVDQCDDGSIYGDICQYTAAPANTSHWTIQW